MVGASATDKRELGLLTAEETLRAQRRVAALRKKSGVRASCQTVIDEICRQVEARLCGDVHEFDIAMTDDGRYRLVGWCSRYHIKQMAQHLAGNLVSEGRLINEIQVRSVR